MAFKQGCLKSIGTLPKFSSAIFFFCELGSLRADDNYARRLRIGLTVEINLTAKKLLKIAIRTTSRTAELAVCKSRIYNFILSAKKYEKKRPNK